MDDNINLKVLHINNAVSKTIKNNENIQVLHITNYSDCDCDCICIDQFKNLKELYINNTSVGDEQIKNCTKLQMLKLMHSSVTDVNHLTDLRVLLLNSHKKMKKEGFIQCTQIEVLDIENTCGICDINHLTNLKLLNAYGNECKPNGEEIKNCTNLEVLSVSYDRNIHNINHLTKLKELRASGLCSNIRNDGFQNCSKLEKIYTGNNKKINKNQLRKGSYVAKLDTTMSELVDRYSNKIERNINHQYFGILDDLYFDRISDNY